MNWQSYWKSLPAPAVTCSLLIVWSSFSRAFTGPKKLISVCNIHAGYEAVLSVKQTNILSLAGLPMNDVLCVFVK